MRTVVFVKRVWSLVAAIGLTACGIGWIDIDTGPCKNDAKGVWVCCDELTPPDHPICADVGPCFNKVRHAWDCCDATTPPQHPTCVDAGSDAGEEVADAGADASDDDGGDAGTDAGNASPGQPSSLVCPWTCTAVGGGGFDDVPSYVWFGGANDQEPPPLGELQWTSWVDVEFAEPNCPACSCVAPEDAEDGCLMPSAISTRSTTCQDNSSATSTSFDPPANWTGSCTAANPIVFVMPR